MNKITMFFEALPAALSEEDIVLLTGETAYKKQAERLKEMQYIFDLNPAGKPIVSRLYFESRTNPKLFKPSQAKTEAAWDNFKHIR